MGACATDRACATSVDCVDTNPCTQGERCHDSSRQCVFDGLDGDGDDQLPVICGGTDCDDDDPRNAAGFGEVCDGSDNNCDGVVDEGEGSVLCVAEGAICVEGRCECPPGQGYCPREDASGFHCIDVLSNPENCGACGLSCPAATTCVDGQCTCAAGLLLCGTTCVDPSSDRRNCGDCGVACGSDNDCIDGECTGCGGLGEPCCGGIRCSGKFTECGPSGTCVTMACAEPFDPLPETSLPRCSAETLSCIQACATNRCVVDCLEADTTPIGSLDGVEFGCIDCIDYQIEACLTRTPCQPTQAALYCCAEARCDGTFDEACEERCALELDDATTCLQSTDCVYILLEGSEPRACFP